MNQASFSRRNALKIMGCQAAVSLCGCGGIVPEGTKRPNFVVILCDDLGYGDPGCYGHPYIQTPAIDRLAAEGMRLTDCYAGAPVCSPSRAAMLTGRTPHRTGVYDYIPGHGYGGKGPVYAGMHLQREEITAASLLRDAGYDTCHVGKWHLASKFNDPAEPQPGDHGFNHWFSTYSNAQPSHRNPDNFVRNGEELGELDGYSAELCAAEAADWLTRLRDKTKPFCLFAWLHEPHEPIATRERFMAPYKGHPEAIYYGNVSQIDYAAGQILDTLDSMGIRDNTLIMFTSDNGPETLNRYQGANRSFGSPKPLRGMKLHMYEGGIRVPGILSWPGIIVPGQVSDTPVSATDVLPTLCDLAGIPTPDDRPIDGTSLASFIRSGSITREIPLYWRYDIALSQPFGVAMRHNDFKILADPGLSVFELYNLRDDPEERFDLAAAAPDVLADMRNRLVPLHTEIDREGPEWPTA